MRQELVQGIIKLSAGNLFLAGLCEVGTEVQERMKITAEKASQQEQQQYKKARASEKVIYSFLVDYCITNYIIVFFLLFDLFWII